MSEAAEDLNGAGESGGCGPYGGQGFERSTQESIVGKGSFGVLIIRRFFIRNDEPKAGTLNA